MSDGAPMEIRAGSASIAGGSVGAVGDDDSAFGDREDMIEVEASSVGYVAPDDEALYIAQPKTDDWLANVPIPKWTVMHHYGVNSLRAAAFDSIVCDDVDDGVCPRSIEEIEERAATSRYWAQRLRWLRKRGRA